MWRRRCHSWRKDNLVAWIVIHGRCRRRRHQEAEKRRGPRQCPPVNLMSSTGSNQWFKKNIEGQRNSCTCSTCISSQSNNAADATTGGTERTLRFHAPVGEGFESGARKTRLGDLFSRTGSKDTPCTKTMAPGTQAINASEGFHDDRGIRSSSSLGSCKKRQRTTFSNGRNGWDAKNVTPAVWDVAYRNSQDKTVASHGPPLVTTSRGATGTGA